MVPVPSSPHQRKCTEGSVPLCSQQDALQRRYILAVIPFFLCVLQKVAFEYKKKGIFSLLYTEVKETNENKDLNIVVCFRQCGSDGAEESCMGGVGS